MVLVETLTAGDSDTWSVWHPVGAPALPTIFTQPSSICSSKWIQNPLTSNEVISGFIYYSTATDRREYYGSLLSPNYYASCHPLRQAEPIAYSPGLCTADQTMLAIREFHYQTSRLWMGICCDYSMTLVSGKNRCEQSITLPITALTNFTTTLLNQNNTVVTISAIDVVERFCVESDGSAVCPNSTTLKRTTELTSGTMIAPPFAVWWESTDLSSFPSLYASGLASLLKISFGTTASISSNDTPPISPPSNTNSDKEKFALSPGAIAGIAVGVGAFVIIGIVFLLYIWRRRKQQRQRLQHRNEPEMEGSPGGFKSFMGEDWRAEADGTTGRVETDGTTGPVEVDEESRAVRAFPGPPVEMDGTQTARG